MALNSDWTELQPESNLKSNDWEEMSSPSQKLLHSGNLVDFLGKKIAGNENKDLFKPFVSGAKEEALKMGRAIPFLGKHLPVPNVENFPDPASQKMQSLGRFAGGIPVFGAVAAPIAATGGMAGLPAAATELASVAGAGALTTPGDVFHRAAGASESMIPYGIGRVSLKLPGAIKTLMSEFNPKEIWKSIQKGHDILSNEASSLFENVRNLGKERNISPNTNPKLTESIENAEDILNPGKKSPMKKLIESAKSGDYDSVRTLQSDLGKIGTDFKLSSLGSERISGKDLLKLRRNINNMTINHLKDLGHNDLADMLTDAVKKYSNLKNTYYKNRTIANLVNPSKRVEPASPKFLERESVAINKLKDVHPEISDALKLKVQREKLLKRLKTGGKVLKHGSYAIPSLAALKYLMSGNKQNSIDDIDYGSNFGEQ